MEHNCCFIGMIRYLSITVGVFLLLTCRGADHSFTLQNGDLLFSVGREYDYLYDESNDTYYCSELVRKVFRDSLGNNLFAPQAMSFTNKETGEMDPYWTEHFRKRGRTVPEGAPGTNPADMTQSENIDIVHVYY